MGLISEVAQSYRKKKTYLKRLLSIFCHKHLPHYILRAGRFLRKVSKLYMAMIRLICANTIRLVSHVVMLGGNAWIFKMQTVGKAANSLGH